MARREHPRYEHMEWPDWEFREYPMMIYPGGDDPNRDARKPEYTMKAGRTVLKYPGVIVQDDNELEAVLSGRVEINARTGAIIGAEDIRQGLLNECVRFGLQVDKSWSVEKLSRALDAAAQPEVVG